MARCRSLLRRHAECAAALALRRPRSHRLVVLLLSMWRFQKLRIVETDDAAPSAAEEEEEEGKGALPQVHEGRLAGGGGDGAQLV